MILIFLSVRSALISYTRYSIFIFVPKMNKYALNIHLCTYIHDFCVFEWLVGFDFLYMRYSNFIVVSKMNNYALNIHLCTYIHDSCVFEWTVGFDLVYVLLKFHLRTKNERICSKYPSFYVYSWFVFFWVSVRLWFSIREIQISSSYKKWTNML